ncbi:unnamed protein product, partial [Prorocentrum cordatum]
AAPDAELPVPAAAVGIAAQGAEGDALADDAAVALPDDDIMAVEPESVDSPNDFTRIQYDGDLLTVYYDHFDRRWKVIYDVTGERHVLPATLGEWILDADTDAGEAYVVEVVEREGVPTQIDLDDVLRMVPYQRESDKDVMFHDSVENDTFSAPEAKRLHQNVALSIKDEVSQAKSKVSIFIFDLPRNGCHVYFDVHGVFEAMDVHHFTQQYGTYICNQWKRWHTAASKLGVHGVLSSAPYQNSPHFEEGPNASRPLSEKTFSTCALIYMLGRWSSDKQRNGRFVGQGAADKAVSFLGRMLKGLFASRDSGITMSVYLDGDFQRRPNGSMFFGKTLCVLPVSTVGRVDFSNLNDLSRAGSERAAALWNLLAQRFDIQDVMLVDFVAWVASLPPQPCHAKFQLQVFCCLGSLIDQIICDLWDEQGTNPMFEIEAFQGCKKRLLQENAMYIARSRSVASADGCKFLSSTFDSSNVRGSTVMNGAYVLPDNRAWWGCPQETAAFVGQATEAHARGDSELEAALADMRDRHQNLLKRKANDGRKLIWRPKKKHRKASANLGCEVDNQMSLFLPKGIFAFRVPFEEAERLPAIEWPRWSVCPDQGPTCVTAVSHWQRKLNVNVDVTWDMCHRWHNDIMGGLKASGLGNHLTLALLRVNIPSSPWHQDERLNQNRDAFDELMKFEAPETCVLFKAMAVDMLKEEAGRSFAAEEHPEQALWNSFKEDNPLTLKDTVVVNSRWVKLIRKLRDDIRNYHQRAFIYLHTCVEMDLLVTDQMSRIVAHSMAIPTVTSARRLTPEELAVRKNNCNQLVMGLMDMLNPDTLRKDEVCVCAAEPWEQAFGEMNATLRNCHDGMKWMLEHLDGHFVSVCMATFKQLSSVAALRYCQFILPQPGAMAPQDWDRTKFDEDQVAECFAHAVMCINAKRISSSAPLLLGWSSRSIYFTRDDDKAKNEIAKLRADADTFEHFQGKGGDIEEGIDFVMRSPFQTMAVQQVYQVVRDKGFALDPEATRFFQKAHSRLLISQCVEDGFNEQKNATLPYANRRASMETNLTVIRERRALSTKHDFKELEESVASRGAGAPHLNSASYQRPWMQNPEELRSLSGYNKQADFYSPRADHWGAQFADQVLAQQVRCSGSEGKIHQAWLGSMFDCRHNIVVRRVRDGAPVGPLLLPLGHMYQSAAIAWPVEKQTITVGESTYEYFVFQRPADERAIFHAVVDHAEWEAVRVEWKSPFSQCLEWGVHGKSHGVFPFARGEFRPILKVLAESCFGVLKKDFLTKLAQILGVGDATSNGLYHILEALVRHELKPISESDLSAIMSKRLASFATEQDTIISVFMDVDGAHEYLTKDDHENLVQSGKKVKIAIAELSDYSTEYKKRRAEIRDALMAAEAL